MKLKILIVALSFPLMGCHTLKKLTNPEDHPAHNSAIPEDYTVTGITSIDLQIIQPVRCLDSDVTVKVLRPGETEWHLCNRYEVKLDPVGVGGGGVWFKKQVDLVGGSLTLTGKPVAPAGTQYEIRSILKVTDHNLY